MHVDKTSQPCPAAFLELEQLHYASNISKKHFGNTTGPHWRGSGSGLNLVHCSIDVKNRQQKWNTQMVFSPKWQKVI